MPWHELILPHVTGLALVLARLTGLFLFAPLLSSPIVPRQFKVLMALGWTFALYPAVPPRPATDATLSLLSIAPLLATELLIGLSIGILASIPLMTAQFAGVIMGQQMGIGLAAVFNPAIDFESDNLGQILFFAALASYLSAGGLEAVYAALVDTYARIPPGAFDPSTTPLSLLVSLVTSGFDVALRVSMPVLLILFLETLAVGFIMKSVPSLNIMNVGFPLRILLGLVVVVSSLTIMLEVLMTDLARDLDSLQEWTSSVRPATPAHTTTAAPQ